MKDLHDTKIENSRLDVVGMNQPRSGNSIMHEARGGSQASAHSSAKSGRQHKRAARACIGVVRLRADTNDCLIDTRIAASESRPLLLGSILSMHGKKLRS